VTIDTFLRTMFFFLIVRSLFPLVVLLLIIAAVQGIADRGLGLVRHPLLALLVIGTSGSFHKNCF